MRVILGTEVASFKINGKRYKPGDAITLPDNFPAHLYPFLKRHAERPAVRAVAVPPARPAKPTPPATEKGIRWPSRK